MAAKSIGAVTFDTFRGVVDAGGAEVQTLDRPGRSFPRWRILGTKPRESQVNTVKQYDSADDMHTAITAYDLMKGTIVTIYDTKNRETTNAAVLDMQIVFKGTALVNGATKYRIEANWTVQAGDPAA